MSTAPVSLAAAFQQEQGEAPGLMGVAADPVQLDLLREGGRMPDNVFQLARAEAARRGPGRKPGSLNKRSTDLAKLLASKYPDPVQYMASLYAMPLDQMTELLLIADGTQARQRELDALFVALAEKVGGIAKLAKGNDALREDVSRLADACEALEAVARRAQGKPGDLAIKALNVQLAAAKAVAEYWHSKKPVEAVIRHQADAVLVMPGVGGAASFDALDSATRAASDVIASALAKGSISADMLVGLRLVDGQLQEGEWTDVPDEGADDQEPEA